MPQLNKYLTFKSVQGNKKTVLYTKQDAQLGIESVGHIEKDSNDNRSK